jgi:hypothetical protein
MRRTLSLELKSVATALIICFAGVAVFASEPDVIWHKFVELTKRPPHENKLRLDALSEYLRADDGAIAYLVSYGGRVSCRGEALARARSARTYLVSNGRINPARIKIIDAGYHDEWVVELWLAPKLAPPLTTESISKNDGHLSRDKVKVLAKCNRVGREIY